MQEDKYAAFEGPSDEELTQAYRRHNRRQMEERDSRTGSSMQGSGRRYVGTPRNAKHADNYNGVRIR